MTSGLDRHSPDKLTGAPSPSRGNVQSGARWQAAERRYPGVKVPIVVHRRFIAVGVLAHAHQYRRAGRGDGEQS